MAQQNATSKHERMEEGGVSRRNLFQILGAVPAAAALTSAATAEGHVHPATAEQKPSSQTPYKRQTFDDHQWQTIQVLSDLIVPADEHSGSATQAGVPEFLDDWIAFRSEQDANENLKAQIFGGLMWLDRESNAQFGGNFLDAKPDQQKQLLDRVAYPKKAKDEDHAWVFFFSELRSLVVSGYFSSKMGVAALPYLGNTAVVHWTGCDPQVWAIVEDRMKNGYQGIVEAKPWNA
jgi:hypothetical protein